MNPIIAPSILSADFGRLNEDVATVVELGLTWIHVDIMDGHFVPNLTMGPQVVSALKSAFPDCTFDVHLMVEHPEGVIPAFLDAGSDVITVHHEATPNVHRALQMIRQGGAKAGVAFNPGSDVSALPFLDDLVDLVLLMTVNPGFGGQTLIPSALVKTRHVKDALLARGRHDVHVEVDGGINPQTVREAVLAGADVLVAGSAVFGEQNRKEAVQHLLQSALLR